jgi:hypothetical protein
MSRIGSTQSTNVSDFNRVSNTTNNTSNAANTVKQSSNQQSQSISKASSEQIKRGTEAISSGINRSLDNLKTSENKVSEAATNIKASTEKILEAAKGFSKSDPFSFANIKQGGIKLQNEIQTLKQGVETVKTSNQDLAEIARIGIIPLKKATEDCEGMQASKEKIGKFETEIEQAIESTSRGLRASDEAIAKGIDRGFQTINYGINLINSTGERALEFIKSGAEAVNRGVDTVTREVGQIAKNVYEVGNDAISSLYDAVSKTDPTEVFRPIGLNPESKVNSNQQDPSLTKPNSSMPCLPDVKPSLNPTLKETKETPPVEINSETSIKPLGDTPKIDRSQLSTTDKVAIDFLGFDNFKPGEKRSVSANGLAEIGQGLYLGAGGAGKVTVERDLAEPSKFRLTIESEAKLEVGLSEKFAKEGAEEKVSSGGKITTTVEIDISKKGEATELAAFAAQVGLATVAAPIATGLLIAEQIPGVNLPGEPIDYLRSRVKTLEISNGLSPQVTAEIATLYGIEGTLAGGVGAGLKIDFEKDGSKVVTGSLNTSAKAEAKFEVGTPVIALDVAGAGVEATVSLERSRVFDKTYKVTKDDTKIKLVTKTQIPTTDVGVSKIAELELSVSLTDLVSQVSPGVGKKFKDAVFSGNTSDVAKILQEEILPNFNLNLEAKSKISSNSKASINADVTLLGKGVVFNAAAEKETLDIISEGKVTLNKGVLNYKNQIDSYGVDVKKQRKDEGRVDFGKLFSKISGQYSPQEIPKQKEPPIRQTLKNFNAGLLRNLLG